MRLLKAHGLAIADARIATFGRQRVLVVERFDRRVASNGQWLMRPPQEDFCRVEGCSPLRKYEDDGGPGLKALFGTLRQSVNAEADMRTLMAAQVLFWLLRAPDGLARTPAAIAEAQAELPHDFSLRVLDAVLGGLEQVAGTLGSMAP